MVNKLLMRHKALFLEGDAFGGGRLTSHDFVHQHRWKRHVISTVEGGSFPQTFT